MSAAPKKIWIYPDLWNEVFPIQVKDYDVEYVRADIVYRMREAMQAVLGAGDVDTILLEAHRLQDALKLLEEE